MVRRSRLIAEWEQCQDAQIMVGWLINGVAGWADLDLGRHSPLASLRKLRLIACACCRAVWHLLLDGRSCTAVEVAERYADGEVKEKVRDAALDAAARLITARTIFEDMACDAAAHGIRTSLAALVRISGDASEAIIPPGSQAAIIREIMGNPFAPVALDSSPLTPTVVDMA